MGYFTQTDHSYEVFSNVVFRPQIVIIAFTRLSLKATILSLNIINQFIFALYVFCAFFEVRTTFLNNI
jgi:hypothetical protein